METVGPDEVEMRPISLQEAKKGGPQKGKMKRIREERGIEQAQGEAEGEHAGPEESRGT